MVKVKKSNEHYLHKCYIDFSVCYTKRKNVTRNCKEVTSEIIKKQYSINHEPANDSRKTIITYKL